MKLLTRNNILLFLVVLLISFCSFIVLPRSTPTTLKIGSFQRDLQIKKGLDLEGGVQLIYKVELDGIDSADREDAFSGVKSVMERRVNFFGVSEALVNTSQSGDNYRLYVELPGVYDVDEALNVIGKTAKLDFRVVDNSAPDPTTPEYTQSGLTGSNLKKAQVAFDQNTGEAQVAIQFDDEGSRKFEEITRNNLNKPLAIFLDDQLITAPTVQTTILDGNAVISGSFTKDTAKQLAIQLNGGALPAPVTLEQQKTVGASLGDTSVKSSIVAGVIGLILVALFMTSYYGVLGFIAVISLLCYALITLTIYILLPVTLTLPGIAGFLLSIGMTVDSAILIFERLKDEVRLGVDNKFAVESAFTKAWNSIRDANVNTLIVCFILFNPLNLQFLNSSGLVRGFALTLSMGIFIGLFTGIVIVRTIIRVFYLNDFELELGRIRLPRFSFRGIRND